VVTVPPPGADPTALWNRFADVVGIDPVRFDTSRTQRSNEGRGWVEVELLRRVNVALDGRIPHPQFNLIVHRFYAGNVLAGMPASRKVMLPANLREVADEIAERWIETIKERGYQIVGDIEDLRPTLPDETSVKPTESEIAALAVAATAELLLEVADREEPARRRRRRKRSIQRKTRSILRTGKQKASGRSARG
jgi:hypothetical protein